MFVIIPDKKKKRGLCCAHSCKDKPTKKDRFCSKHRHRYNKYINHCRYTYQALKANARRRGKAFTITIEEFRVFCDETGYLKKKGRLGSSASIDRINPDRGYEPDNIQILSVSENVAKRWSDEQAPF